MPNDVETAEDLYTVIFDYRGGTYISQVLAVSPHAALLLWARELDVAKIMFLGDRRKRTLISRLEDDEYEIHVPVALEGLTNAWCTTALPGSLVTLIKTESR